MAVVYDATAPVEQHVLGPGRFSHAFPHGSRRALCGVIRTENPPVAVSPRCPSCEQAIRNRWVAR